MYDASKAGAPGDRLEGGVGRGRWEGFRKGGDTAYG